MTTPPRGRRNKYFAIKTKGHDGRTYDSKLEARVADELWLKRQSGGIVDYIPQVTITFASGTTWRCDFMVIDYDCVDSWGIRVCGVKFIEAKGRDTERWRVIQKLLKHEKPWLWERLEVRRK